MKDYNLMLQLVELGNLKNICTDGICQILSNLCGYAAGRKVGKRTALWATKPAKWDGSGHLVIDRNAGLAALRVVQFNMREVLVFTP